MLPDMVAWTGLRVHDCGLQALTQNPELFNMVVRRSQVPGAGDDPRQAQSPSAAGSEDQPNLDCRMT